MAEARLGQLQGPIQEQLQRRRRHQVVAADHVAHLLEGVVDHHRELVGIEPVTAANDEVTDLGTDEEGLAPSELARHVMDFLSPQVAKALIESGLKDKIEGLKDDGVKKLGEELKEKAGGAGDLIEGAIGNVLGGKKKTEDDDPDGNN